MFDPTLAGTRDSPLMSKLDDAHPNASSGKEQRHDVLHDSDVTPSTDSEEDGGWLGGFTSDFRTLANTIRGVVPGAIGGAATYVQRSALAVAAEIAQLECENRDAGEESFLPFPWELAVEGETPYDSSYYEEDEELKAKIFALSCDHDTFLKPYTVDSSVSGPDDKGLIVLDEPRIHLIRCLLDMDENLGATHAHLQGRNVVKEAVFWTNYFYNCDKVRKEHFKQGASNDERQCPAILSPDDAGINVNDDDNKSNQNSQNSLVPADDTDFGCDGAENEDDSSYICVNASAIASPPCSLKSVEDLVIVNKSVTDTN